MLGSIQFNIMCVFMYNEFCLTACFLARMFFDSLKLFGLLTLPSFLGLKPMVSLAAPIIIDTRLLYAISSLSVCAVSVSFSVCHSCFHSRSFSSNFIL